MDSNLRKISSMMRLEQKRQELIAQNIAGSSIVGFKQQFIVSDKFEDVLNKNIKNSDTPGKKTELGTVMVDFSQGMLKPTSRKLDFAITGEGFFEVKKPDGMSYYTRNGSFHVSNDNTLVTAEGYEVVGKNGKITFNVSDNLNNLEVTPDGMVRVRSDDGKDTTDIGFIKLVDFKDKSKLFRATANYFVNNEPGNTMEEVPNEKFELINSFLETANNSQVPMRNMAQLIQCSRDFEMGQKVLKMLDGRTGKLIRALFE